MTDKLTKSQAAALAELLARPGHTSTPADWTTGRGNHQKYRPVPPFAVRVYRGDGRKLPRRVQAYFDARPRLLSVFTVLDVRGAKRALAIRDRSERKPHA